MLAKYDLKPLKRLGQNFLVDPNIAEKIISACEIDKNDHVIEIGPGFGQLTEGLCRKSKSVTAVEVDKKMCQALRENTREIGNLDIVCGDFLEFDIAGYLDGKGIKKVKIYGNLPYYITSPILVHILENKKRVDSVYILVQKEVAKRLSAGPGTADSGAITCFTQYHSIPKILFNVSKGAFYPQPEVDSAFMKLEIPDKPGVAVKDEKLFFKIIRASFGQRRKTLLNSLSGSKDLGLSKEKASELLAKAGIDGNRRGETLSLNEFAKIADAEKA